MEQETVDQYKWRFRQYALVQAHRHSVDITAVCEALSDMGAELPIGPGVEIGNYTDLRNLPPGTIVYRGDPDQPDTFGVFVVSPGYVLVPVLGPVESPDLGHNQIIVESMNGDRTPVPWLSQPPGKDESAKIALFMKTAWRRGMQLKEDMDWCSAYNTLMREFGLTPAKIRMAGDIGGVTVGSTVRPLQAAALPVGTVLRHENHTERVWFMRVDRDGPRQHANVARTRRIFGRRLDGSERRQFGHYAESMVVEAFPDAEHGLALPVDWENEWDLLPVGTRLAYPDDDGRWWICADHKATYDERMHTGSYDLGAFDTNQLTIFSFPVPS
jgi:hypothetical protein